MYKKADNSELCFSIASPWKCIIVVVEANMVKKTVLCHSDFYVCAYVKKKNHL